MSKIYSKKFMENQLKKMEVELPEAFSIAVVNEVRKVNFFGVFLKLLSWVRSRFILPKFMPKFMKLKK